MAPPDHVDLPDDRQKPLAHAEGADESKRLLGARQVRNQDVDLTGPAPSLFRGVAATGASASKTPRCATGARPDRSCSTGYKRHVLRDPLWRSLLPSDP
jgi:hypothetical protein